MGRTDRMKVVICTDGVFPHAVGGMQRHSRLLVEALAETGAVDLVVLHPHPGIRVFEAHPQVEEVALAPLPGKKHYFLELKDYSKLVMAELDKRPDHIVYAQGLSVWADAGRVKGRLIVNPHGLEPFQALGWKDWAKTWPYRRVLRHLFKVSARVVSLGGRLTDIITENGGRGHVVVLPNATNLLPQPPEALIKRPAQPMRFLFVGRFASNKGIGDLLAAAQLLNAQGLQDRFVLDLAGKGPLFEDMKARYPLPNVHFMGFTTDEQLDAAYLEDQVFVFPTLFEGMPTVVLEAMARAMPILVTDTGATRELVDTHNGLILPKRDPAGVAAAMRAMLELEPTALARLSQASLTKVQERFSWPAVAEGHLALFREMWHSS